VETSLNSVYNSVIIRFSGEIWIKKHWTRRQYVKQLGRNIRKALKQHQVDYTKLVRRHSRLYLKTSSPIQAANVLTRVFGISSVSPAIETFPELDKLIEQGLQLAELMLKPGDTFAVKCKRVGKHDYSSADVQKLLGQKVLEKYVEKLGLKVNLDNPDVTLGVEVREDQAFVYSQVIHGPGGMPLGVQPQLIGLFSGGIDSAVGIWLVMKRGCPVVPVYFDNNPYTDETTKQRALRTAEVLFSWAIGFPRNVYVVQHGENLKQIMKTNRKYSCLLCKRMMYRVAERLAEQLHAEGIVTGEAIGEQASQTLTNLRVLNSAVRDYPVHRPLLGFDKAETEAIARKIGTYPVTSMKAAGCSAVPYQPSTKAKLEEVLKAEEKLDIESMVKRSLETIQIIEL